MKLLRTLAVTFSLYSRIPMPHFKWNDRDMRYSMAAFPIVGAVIGFAFLVIYGLCIRYAIPDTASALLLTAVPVIITGGFHIDGFMDTSDALSSYKTREEKLRILKDPHIGAFSVIRLAACGLIYIASLITILYSEKATLIMYIAACGFVLSRAMSALGVLVLEPAKKDGMLKQESESAAAGKAVNKAVVILWILLTGGLMVFIDLFAGGMAVMAVLAWFAVYRHRCNKEFGGITGDTAGWFVVICETVICAAGAVCAVI